MANNKKDFSQMGKKALSDIQGSKIDLDDESIITENDKRNRILTLKITDIKENPNQPRMNINKESVEELAGSIKQHGMQNPILVSHDKENNLFYLVGGSRRLEALKQLKEDTVKAIVTESDPEIISIIDNLQREDLHPLERARAVKKLYHKYNNDKEKVGEVLSVSVRTIERLMSLDDLSRKIIPENKEESALFSNNIPLREYYGLLKYSKEDEKEVTGRFYSLKNKYDKEIKTDPVNKREILKKDDIEKVLSLAKKIKKELGNIGLDIKDERVAELLALLKELAGMVESHSAQKDKSLENNKL